MSVMEILKSRFVKVAAAGVVVTKLAGCADVDPGVAAAAGAALGYGIGNELNDEWGGYAGGALGAVVANAASNRARACETNTSLNRQAVRNNITGGVEYDQTSQSASTDCTKYGGAAPVASTQPIFGW